MWEDTYLSIINRRSSFRALTGVSVLRRGDVYIITDEEWSYYRELDLLGGFYRDNCI